MTTRCAPQFGAKRPDSPIEAEFALAARALKFPPWVRNYRFLKSDLGRNFELDFAWPELRFGVEIDGHVHRIRDRFDTDREKGAYAILTGWVVMHLTGLHVRNGRGIEWARQAIVARAELLRSEGTPDSPPHRLASLGDSRHQPAPIRASELAYGTQT